MSTFLQNVGVKCTGQGNPIRRVSKTWPVGVRSEPVGLD